MSDITVLFVDGNVVHLVPLSEQPFTGEVIDGVSAIGTQLEGESRITPRIDESAPVGSILGGSSKVNLNG